MNLQDIAEKYYEYKETLERIEDQDYQVLSKVTISQYEMMRKIVDTLEDMGFNLIIRRTN